MIFQKVPSYGLLAKYALGLRSTADFKAPSFPPEVVAPVGLTPQPRFRRLGLTPLLSLTC